MAAQGEPTNGIWEEYLHKAAEEAEERDSGRNERIEGVRDARKHLSPPKLPDIAKSLLAQMTPAVVPAVEETIRAAQGLYGKKLPRPYRAPTDITDSKARDDAENIALWWADVQEHMFADEYPKITDAFPQDGMAAWMILLEDHAWHIRRGKDEEPEAYNARLEQTRRDYFPIFAKHIDSTTYHRIATDEHGLAEAIIITEQNRSELYERFGADLGPAIDQQFNSGGSSKTVRFLQYFNRNRIVYMDDTNNKVLKVVKHRYKIVPIFDPDFSTTSISDPKFSTEGIADPLVGVQKELEAIDTYFNFWAFRTAFPSFQQVSDSSDDLGGGVTNSRPIVVKPLQQIEGLAEGKKLETFVFPGLGTDLLKYRAAKMDERNRLSLAPVLLGLTETSQSGPMNVNMMEAARGILAVSEGNFTRAWNRSARFVLFIVDQLLKDDVPIESVSRVPGTSGAQWMSIGAKQIKGDYRISHSVEAVTRVVMAIEQQTARLLYQDKIIPREEYARRSGVENPVANLRAVDIEEFRDSNMAKTTKWTIAVGLLEEAMGGAPQSAGPPPGMGTPSAPSGGPAGVGMPQVGNQAVLAGVTPMTAPGPTGMNPAPPMPIQNGAP